LTPCLASAPGSLQLAVLNLEPLTPCLASAPASLQLAVLNLILALGVKDQELYPLFLVASNDSAEAVSRRAEELLKRRAGAVDLEDPALVARLLALFQGTPVRPPGGGCKASELGRE